MRRPTIWPRAGLWRHHDFLHLWAAQTVSLCGTQVTALALPTVAILALHATPVEVGALAALQWLGFLVVGLVAGVVVDRLPRRRIMVAADLVRMLALGSVPLAFAVGLRAMAHLYAVAAVTSVSAVFFDVAYQSYLPALVARDRLVEGNTKLALADGAARVGGPALGGLLIQLVGAATAVAADAVSYLASALLLAAIRTPEPRAARAGEERGGVGALVEMREGITAVVRQPIVRTLAVVSALQNFGGAVAEAVVLLFAYRSLHLTPGLVGAAFALGSVGFALGALGVALANRALGVGRTLSLSSLLGGCSYFLIPLGLFGAPVLAFAAWRLVFGLSLPTWNVNALSLRQAVIPDHLQGRVNATLRTLGFGALAMGPLVGGALGSRIGFVPTILVGSLIYLVGSLPLLSRAVRTLKEQPATLAA